MWDEITYPFSNRWSLGMHNGNILTSTVFSFNDFNVKVCRHTMGTKSIVVFFAYLCVIKLECYQSMGFGVFRICHRALDVQFGEAEIDSPVIGTVSQISFQRQIEKSWWRHQMETFSALLALWAGHRSPVSYPHKGQWRGALMFSLICTLINAWVNNREAGDLIRHRAHYGVIIINGEMSGKLIHPYGKKNYFNDRYTWVFDTRPKWAILMLSI